MTFTSPHTTYFLKLQRAIRVLGILFGVCLCVYIYFVFSTTSLIAQHRSYDKQLNEMIAQRSDLEYEYHATAEQLFATSAATYNLSSPTHLSYISLSRGVNVAFARGNE